MIHHRFSILVASIILSLTGCSLQKPDLPDSTCHPCGITRAPEVLESVDQSPSEPDAENTSLGELYYQLGVDKNPQAYAQAIAWFEKAARRGDPHAQNRLAELYANGLGTQRDFIKASEWLRMAAASGILEAQKQLGDFYRHGKGVPKDNQKAILWYTRAAEAGFLPAILALGELYKGWSGMTPDFEKAIDWYRQGASLGSAEAEYQVAWLLARGVSETGTPTDYFEAARLLKASGEKGQVDAYAQLGDLYYQGRLDGGQNLKLARAYYRKAAEKGSGEGAFRMGMLALFGELDPCDCSSSDERYRQAVGWFKQAAEAGLPMAQYQLGLLYLEGHGTPRNCELAVCYLRQAAEQKLPFAQTKLADLYHAGRANLPRDLRIAFRWYERAADENDTYALLMLNVMTHQGRGTRADFEKSVIFADRAAEQANLQLAQYQVAMNFLHGRGLDKNLKYAEQWLLLAASSNERFRMGLASAQAALGDLYLATGEDMIRAYHWYRLAANQGLTYGEYNTAILLYRGSEELQNIEPTEEQSQIALALLKRAARKGFRPAQMELGWLYFNGSKGVAKNYKRAYAWWASALEHKFETNPEWVEYVIDQMSPDVQSLVVKYAKRFRQKYSPMLANQN